MKKTGILYKLLFTILILTQVFSALPIETGSLLSGLWFVWIIMSLFFALIICTERRAINNNSFAILLLLFWLMNAISFYISPKHVQSLLFEVDTLVIFKSITIALFSYFTSYYYAKRGVIDNKNLKGFVVLLFVTSFLNLIFGNYIRSKESLEQHNVLNQAYLLVQLIPLILIYMHGKVQYVFVGLTTLLVLWGSKRGAIMCIGVELFVYYLYLLKESTLKKKNRGSIILLALILLLILSYFIQNNEFLQERLLTTGTYDDKSGEIRTERYLMLYTIFFNSSSVFEILFGHGFAQTVSLGDGLAHQDWAELLIDNGMIGLILYIILILICVKTVIRCNSSIPKSIKYALICCVTNWCLMATYSMAYTSREAFILFLTLGIINGFIQREKKANIQLQHLKYVSKNK